MRDLSTLLPWLTETPGAPDPLAAAHAAGRAEAEDAYRSQLAALKIEQRAAGRLHDPADALAWIDSSDFDAEDVASIDSALNALLAEKPHLGAPQPDLIETGDDLMRAGFAAARRDPRMARLR